MSATSKLLAAVVTAGLALLVAALSQWPVEREAIESIIRLSWRTEPVRAEECRTLTDEELAEIPAHMRRAEECVGEYVDYELSITVDRSTRVDTVSPSGLRRDRPVYVLRELRVPPGDHAVEVHFQPVAPDWYEGEADFTGLAWRGTVSLERDEVGLITLNAAGRALELRTARR